jgi:hypothetical protein
MGDLQAVTEVLRYFEQAEEAERIIDEYIANRVTLDQVIKMRSHPGFDGTIQDEYILAKLQTIYDSRPQKSVTFRDAIVKVGLADPHEFAYEELKFLEGQSSNEFYDFFKSYSDSDQLYSIIISCLKHGETLPQTTEALKRIARESRIDMLRVTRLYRINVKEDSDTSNTDLKNETEGENAE